MEQLEFNMFAKEPKKELLIIKCELVCASGVLRELDFAGLKELERLCDKREKERNKLRQA